MAKTKNNIIEINSDGEFKIKIERGESISESFFRNVYEKAMMNTKEIIQNNEEYYEILREYKKDKFKYYDKEEKNNIIMFTGERGSGKTSAMVSFANLLSNTDDRNKAIDMGVSQFKLKDDCKFWVLGVIDPSLFEKDESVFQVVIAKLFEEFKEMIENQAGCELLDKQRVIIRQFKKVYDNFKYITMSTKVRESNGLEENLEALSNLAASSNMKQSFIKLIKLLLDYKFGEKNIEKHYLVLAIDDLDMNIGKATDMAEQIRKYLMVPNVIILMAGKVEQLIDSVNQEFLKQYSVLLEDKGRQLTEDTDVMAIRYIEKLVPNGRKLYLPTFNYTDQMKQIKLKINYKDLIIGNEKGLEGNMEDIVLGLIYKKTGLVFLKKQERIHFLVPDNLRELHNLLAILNKLEDVKLIGTKNIEVLEKNLEVFENYFFNIWIYKNLSSQDSLELNELRYEPIENKNKFVIGKLHEKQVQLLNSTTALHELKENYTMGLKIIYDRYRKNNYDISIGDLLEVLTVKDQYDTLEMKKYKFVINVIYSISMLKLIYINQNQEGLYKITAGNVLSSRVYRTCMSHGRAQRDIDDCGKLPIDIKFKERKVEITVEDGVNFLCGNETVIREKLKDLSEEEINEFKQPCMRAIEFIYYFIYIRRSKTNGPIYDLKARIGTGNNAEAKGQMSILAFITKLLYPQKLIDNIFDLKIENSSRNEESISERKKELDVYSIYHELQAWYEEYKVALPLYSIDVLMRIKYLFEKEDKYTDYKLVVVNREYDAVLFLIKMLENALEDIETTFIGESEMEVKFKEAFSTCPIVKKIRTKEIEKTILYILNRKENEQEERIIELPKEFEDKCMKFLSSKRKAVTQTLEFMKEFYVNTKEIDPSNNYILEYEDLDLIEVTTQNKSTEILNMMQEIVNHVLDEIKEKVDEN